MYRLESISIGVVAFVGLLACSSGYCRWFVQKRETFPNELLSHRYAVLALDGNACVRCAYVRLTIAGLDRSCGLYCRTLDVVVLEFLHSFSHLALLCVASFPCGTLDCVDGFLKLLRQFVCAAGRIWSLLVLGHLTHCCVAHFLGFLSCGSLVTS